MLDSSFVRCARTVVPALVLLLAAAAGVPARAQSDGETIGQLRERLGRLELEHARLQQENQTMLTQLQVVETRKKLRAAQEDEGVGVLPLIVSVSRVDDAWSARLQGTDGVISSFAVGDVPQKGVRVVEISASGVKVEAGGGKQSRRVSLAFAGATSATMPGVGLGMPMPLPASLTAGSAQPR